MAGTSFLTDETPAGDSNQITVSTNAVGLTAAKILVNQEGGFHKRCVRAFITVETSAIRVLWSGVTPTSTLGHLVNALENFVVEGEGNVDKLRMIRDTGASSDATVTVTYFYNV